jgi:hypothetical protein
VTGRGRHRENRVRRYPLLAAAVVVLVVLGVYFGVMATHSKRPSASTPPVAASSTRPSVAPTSVSSPAPIPGITPATAPAPTAATIGLPVRLTVASIGVNTGLQSLTLLSNGTLQSPSSWNVAGWYAGGIRPGQIGPAVIAGHIDSTSGPAVFYRLSQLKVGAQAQVTEDSGSVLTFVVDDVQSFEKDKFPDDAVYGPTPYPELRLITCTGDFDYKTHNYLSNLVVSAHLVSGDAS